MIFGSDRSGGVQPAYSLQTCGWCTREQMQVGVARVVLGFCRECPTGIAMVNSKALEVSKVTKDTKSPPAGMVVKDPVTGEPTGMIRNAYSVLKGVPREGDKVAPKALRDGVKKLFRLYNERGLTSISDRAGSKSNLDLYRSLAKEGELTLRVNCSRGFGASGSEEELEKRAHLRAPRPTD